MSTDVLNRRRGNVKGQLTKLSKTIDEDKDGEMEMDMLIAHKELLSKLSKKFEDLKVEYYSKVSDTEIDNVEASLSEIDDEISKLEVRISSSIQKLKLSNKMPNDDHLKIVNNVKPANNAPKLPDIPLPIFSGKIEEYCSFKSQFLNLIDQNSSLSDVDKLHYLRGALRDEAKVQTLEDTYTSLFEALDKRYDNKRLIIDIHIKSLLNFEPIKHESEKDLRNLTDCIKINLRALSVLKLERDALSNAILLNMLLSKLDKDTRKMYEASLTNNEVPDFDEFIAFLERRAQILGSIARNTKPNNVEKSKTFLVKSNKFSKACLLCEMTHQLYQCSKFKEMKLEDRFDFCKRNKICMKCLSHNYEKNGCRSKGACRVCSRANHHTLLHKYSTYNGPSNNNSMSVDTASPTQYEPQTFMTGQQNMDHADPNSLANGQLSFFSQSEEKCVLINTALVYVLNSEGKRIALRAILDSASESSFLSTDAANALGLKKEKANIPICGLGDSSLRVTKHVSANVSNYKNDCNWAVKLLIVPKIADAMPGTNLNISNLRIPKGIYLADPKFFLAQKVDLLLGAELFYDFLREGKIKLSDNLILQASCFGYLVSGSIQRDSNSPINHCFLSTNLDTLNKTLMSFWEIENPFDRKICDSEELNYCNDHFENTHFRKPDGRFVVEMPFKPGMSGNMLGESKQMASKRLNRLWFRLENDPTMKALYSDFLNEYEALGHMEEVAEEADFSEGYYIPHHGILRPTSESTELRVVYDASAKSTNKYSLNDLLCKGEVIQEDLFSILMRFRKHKYVFTTDIKQMFRQIEVTPSQTKFLKILWKDSKSSPIKTYKLKTVQA